MKFNKSKTKAGGKLTRKQQRKEMRKQKKQKRNEYYTNRNKPGKFVLNNQQNQNMECEEDMPINEKKEVKRAEEDSRVIKSQVGTKQNSYFRFKGPFF